MKYSVESMISMVQIYIHLQKNIEINIKIVNFADVKKLESAYSHAKEWMINNNFKLYGKT